MNYRQRTPCQITLSCLSGDGAHRLLDDDFCDHFAGSADCCTHSLTACSVRALWGQVQQAVDQILSRTTLADLLEQGYALADEEALLDISA